MNLTQNLSNIKLDILIMFLYFLYPNIDIKHNIQTTSNILYSTALGLKKQTVVKIKIHAVLSYG